MTEEFFDAGLEAKKKVNKRYTSYYEKAKAASDGGKLKLVSERVCEPFQGHWFELDKGQVIRYEVMDGPQILDTIYHVRSRPTQEWADPYHTTVLGAITPMEGMHYYSNTPFTRPLLSFIKDTVDMDKIRGRYGPTAAHSFIYNNARCTSGIYEIAYGVANHNSCDMNLKQVLVEVLGEEQAKLFHSPAAFMHFQAVAFDKAPINVTYYPNADLVKKGDYVELLAHDDLYVFISPCPLGDQNDTSTLEGCVNWPFKVAIYEGAEGPLETAPDPQHKTTDPYDFNKAGRPGMGIGKVGKKE
jgi:uncharacterized protein YcgI (DUF1989 family)